MRKASRKFYLLLIFATLLFMFVYSSSGCNRSQSISNTKPTPPPATEFERDLQQARDNQYKYIYVLARRDGAAFTSDDSAYLKANAPLEVNMWLKTDEGRRVIAGSNFTFKPEHIEALAKRFTIDDYTGR